MSNRERLEKLKDDWKRERVIPLLKRFPERKKEFKTSFDGPVEILYTPKETEDYEEKIGFPGQYPFTRGVQPTMYRGRLWTMRQYAGFGTAEESNQRYRYLLSQGQTGLSVAFDLPTQIGYDSDDPMSEGEVGRVGVAIDSLEDMETLFEGIPLERVSTSMTINSTAAILLAMYIAVGEKQGVDPSKLTGTIQNDILKEYIARGTYIFPPDSSMRLITDIFEYCSKNLPDFNTISISGYHIREAGANSVQEIAFTLADGIAYVQAAIDAGLDPNVFGKRLSFFFNSHNGFLEEIAKFRAARRLWARIMKERFGVTDEKAMMLRFHTQTGGSTLTAQQPMNNIVRVAFQALAAVLGGTQSLHTNSFDEALGLPTEDSVTIALRTQQIIASETGVADTVDPLGGAYFIEELTDRMEELAMDYIQKIDDLGGMVEAVRNGFVQKEILDSAYKYQVSIENKEQIIVGVNEFVSEDKEVKDILRLDPAIENRQKKKIEMLRTRRDNGKVESLLDDLREAARGSDNLMPFILKAVKAYATLGEIANALRDVFGEYTEAVIL
ncbi:MULTISPECIES: methylmalonyl-CoA mutase family protein [Mesotoga]|uniref:Methylmalonyl-CoA mutase family protein n=3 Tax=Mesotoga TaxID=1184396 RepID=I2F5H3_9BACT|nr:MULTISPECIES: methylmalonyl-CoA mutase family protein [Mesotoga]MCP5457128.1 methylmalonyl-CoA mutase family protein [Thermotogota bacterium]CCU83851.1 Methylmalonyl-CoA mutase, large subunit [Mesotoga infera]AFK07176.1 methylmalonyl-CoA mutase family protein [Mesotoga prima MesG1.Ag.4.2]MCP5460347.1 methylmalonyl-CoA mutase family protein [Thermotogota bacterium]HNQ71081.1 methylmalonyl-CoA mutase family protein [Mesotoga prima]